MSFIFKTKHKKMKLSLFLFCILVAPLSAKSFQPQALEELSGVGFGEESGIVRRAFQIHINGCKYAYNPSIVPLNGGYLLVFRKEADQNRIGVLPQTLLGSVHLSHNFQQLSECKYFKTGNQTSEDPRVLQTEKGVYMSYGHVQSFTPILKVGLALSRVDAEKQKVIHTTDLQYSCGPVEKNWTPFVYKNKLGEEDIYFVYKFFPHRILKLTDELTGALEVAYEADDKAAALARWEKNWGLIRGGTPAIKIGDEYLSFFHSSFRSNGILYYIFGAITFESEPPFRVKRISSAPIFFKGIYDIPVTKRVWFYPRKNMRVIFPSGVVQGREEGRECLYVVCGENDVAIKCVVLDQQILLDSLIDADQ